MKNDDKYYTLYEDRYRRVYEQGIEYWSADPEEIAREINNIEQFLNYTGCHPSTTSIIEFGCGEGYLAKYLLECGFRYRRVMGRYISMKIYRRRKSDKKYQTSKNSLKHSIETTRRSMTIRLSLMDSNAPSDYPEYRQDSITSRDTAENWQKQVSQLIISASTDGCVSFMPVFDR